ncbi:MAG: transcription termination/antitermination protein NusG [Candidatus Peregrinibacteria bacterium]|nr:transcription termination/antitermination protein NusG [Candidatus Peregrinibacteria bacterium]
MAKQDPTIGRNWYVIHTYAGYEDAVKKALEQRIESMGMQEYVFEVVVPKEKVAVIKKNKQVIEEKNLFPGYVLVNMIVTDNSWFMVRNTPNVTGFVGSGNIPVPVLPEEFGVIKRRMGADTPTTEIKLAINDLVSIKEGPFSNYEGKISEVNKAKGKVTVMVSIFDRETPVELDFNQVVKKI